jgi:hypothetical protein
MNRRAFLQLFIGTVSIAAIPIPKFLLPKETTLLTGDGIWTVPPNVSAFSTLVSGNAQGNFSSGVLTQEMIEEAVAVSAMNMGRPDVIYMSKKSHKQFAKLFGYKVIYRGDDIAHVRI